MDAQMVNASFARNSDFEAYREKVAADMRELIQDHIYEAGFARRVLPSKPPGRLQVSTTGHDTLHCVLELPTPDVRAMTIDFRGDTQAAIVRGPKVAVAFWTIQTEKQQVIEQELLAYDNPIITMVEERIPKAIQAVEDRTFVTYAELAVQATQLLANGVATALNSATIAVGGVVEDAVVKGELARVAFPTASAVPLPLQRPDVVRTKKLFLRNKQLRGETLLITEFDYADVAQWTIEDLGNELTGETLRSGFKAETFFNTRLTQTLKTNILRPGNAYMFAPPEALGVFYTLNDTKFFIDKRGNKIEFWAWEDIGMCIANIRAVAKLELYPCDANPTTNADGLLANVTTAAENALGVLNNDADNNNYVRTVVQF